MKPSNENHSQSRTLATRTTELARHYEAEACIRTDRQFAALMLLQWLASIGVTLMISPQTWQGPENQIHPHLIASILLGAIINVAPITLAVLYPGIPLTRHVIAVAQALMSALLIHLTGGRIETHFHVFGSLAFLSFYRDWRVLATTAAVVTVDHLLRGWYLPMSVYGSGVPTLWRSLEHAGWVVFEVVFLILSIHHIREATLQAASHQAEAEFANQAKSLFLTTMSHKLRTPLNGILGMNELFLQTKLSEQQARYVDAARTSGRLLLQQINNVLDLSKIEAGKVELDLRECQIEALIFDVTDAMSFGAMQKGLLLRTHVNPSACVTAMCDSHRLRQILVNLIGNAIKFTATGSVTISAECLHRDQFNARIRFCVTDTGIGIPAEKHDCMFRPFTQAESSTTQKFGGTGLGLSISKELVELMRGRIGIDSEIGDGSTFWFEVPVQVNESTAGNAANVGQAEAQPQLNAHVLVAEDNRINQMFVQELLNHFGCTCDLAENGDVAVKAVQSQRYDLVLMDCQMPVLDGFNAAREIRRCEVSVADSRRIPIIALTANAVKGDRERCIEAGMDDYLTKPLNADLLHKTLLQHLTLQEAGCLEKIAGTLS
ncbi:MAG: ATP-binding protein [Planctomycetaceae bacterium]